MSNIHRDTNTPDSYLNSQLRRMEVPKAPTPQSLRRDLNAQKCIAAIVMSAGTGKSYIRRLHPSLQVREADEICHPRETPKLDEYRTLAKDTGDWTLYDSEMSSILRDRLMDGDVVMVASYPLAESLDANILGLFVLTPSCWVENVEFRGSLPSKYIKNYSECYAHPSALIFNNRKDLCDKVKLTVESWQEYLSTH